MAGCFYCNRHCSCLTADDQAGPATVGQVGPDPVEHHREPAAQIVEKSDVYCAPEPPREGTAKPQPAEIHDRGFAADRRQAAQMAVDKRARIGTTFDACPDQFRGVCTSLLCCGREAWHRIAIPG